MAAKRKATALLHHHKETMSTPEPSDNNENDQYSGLMKDADKLKLMLLAWNYHNQAQARASLEGDAPTSTPQVPGNDVAGLWASYHSALGLGKNSPPREPSSPVLLGGEAGSAHDETSSSGHKDDEEASEDEAEELRIDALAHDPERLKAFNMFVRLFVDENLDRMVPISKQPKEKIQAIIDSCTRQFPEFAERARKRIRTYLKSCRRNKKCRDGGAAWDASVRPTPAHLTSVQAEQILAQACENESHNAKRMRVGLEPVSQPMPVTTSMSTETTVAPSLTLYPTLKTEEVPLTSLSVGYATPTSATTPIAVSSTPKPLVISSADIKSSIGSSPSNLMNGLSNSSSASATPTSLYRPNFTQAFQRVSSAPGNTVTPATSVSTAAAYAGALFPAQTFNPGLITNGPTDLSMKSRPLLSHKLSAPEMGAVRQLITGYRESAAFLLRSADELEALLLQQ